MDTNMKKAFVIGAGGFIGHNLVKRLKTEGWWVLGLDLKYPEFEKSPADEFRFFDARICQSETGLSLNEYVKSHEPKRIYQLAADMGGAGHIFSGDNDAEIMTNSASINLKVAKQLQDYKGILFYSSSVCAYSKEQAKQKIKEEDIYPANPDSNYGWEKIFSERVYQAFAKNKGLNIRIARFNNCFGPYCTWDGGREKSPAAICRKALTQDPVEIWGDGQQVREFIYIDDLLDAIEVIMQSDHQEPINIGPDESYTIDEMVRVVTDKEIKHIDGPIGLQVRLTDNTKIKSLGWSPKISVKEGMNKLSLWIQEQIQK